MIRTGTIKRIRQAARILILLSEAISFEMFTVVSITTQAFSQTSKYRQIRHQIG